ncbi:PhnD/SsuA/transferrin family substrate-binding protein [Pandoraea pulmonicola]|uniref:Solute-binding protein family 3/N-terminal domain-containing protein n=1 Tax=Pandoraea pulmonicola TaxID=93221 RepID=A0ABM6FSQ5_PANPU|nr:PhnD/SsuA/transferrin family substrate-binding protein [Pandoraea pulmonicola]APD13579.1 hypothetical protein RO07_00395 [Pandoraea pulmonicola]
MAGAVALGAPPLAVSSLAYSREGSASASAIPAGVTLRVGLASRLGPDVQLQIAGALRDLPYRIEWASFDAAPPALEALLGGHIDVFSGGDTPTLAIASRPGSAFVVGAQNNGLYGALLVRGDSPLRQVSELKGKRVAVFRGSGFHNSLVSIVEQAGLRWQDIEPVYLTPADGLSALVAGKVDAWGIWDPNAAIAQRQYGARILATPQRLSYSFQFASRSVLQDEARRAALQDYLVRAQTAADWVRAHPQAWAGKQIEAARLALDAATLAASRTGGQFTPIDDTLIATVQQEADRFASLGIIARAVDVRPVFDARFNTVLAAASGRATA